MMVVACCFKKMVIFTNFWEVGDVAHSMREKVDMNRNPTLKHAVIHVFQHDAHERILLEPNEKASFISNEVIKHEVSVLQLVLVSLCKEVLTRIFLHFRLCLYNCFLRLF